MRLFGSDKLIWGEITKICFAECSEQPCNSLPVCASGSVSLGTTLTLTPIAIVSPACTGILLRAQGKNRLIVLSNVTGEHVERARKIGSLSRCRVGTIWF